MTSLPAVLGINLWLVALVVPYLLALSHARVGHGAPYWVSAALPLAPILLFSYLRHLRHPIAATALLCGVPLLCVVPGADGTLLYTSLPRLAVAIQAVVLLLYLVAASRALSAPCWDGPEAQTTPLQAAEVPLRWRRRVFLYRALFVLCLAVPLVMLYGIDLHPANLRALRLSFGRPGAKEAGSLARISAVQAAATAAVALLWVAAYRVCFLGLLSGHLLHDREVNLHTAALQKEARRGRPRPQFYLAMLLALGSMISLIWRSLRSP